MLGFSRSELGQSVDTFFSLLHPDDLEPTTQAVQEAFRRDVPEYRHKFRCRGKDGSYRWIEARGWLKLDAEGKPLRMLGTHADITRERQAQEELESAKEAALAAAQAKSEFLATMSHEIRTPLNAVIGLGALLEETSLDTRQQELVATIRSSSQILLSLVNDILDFSIIDAGHLILEEVSFSPRAIVRDCMDLSAIECRRKGLDLRCEAGAVAPWVRGDAARLRQVVLNLLSNAVKFTERGSVIIRLSSAEPGWLSLSVEDTGIGIEPDAQARLFHRFVQADSSTRRRFGGSGLGLAICKAIVDAMGGTLTVSSVVGKGSQFHLRIPAPPGTPPDLPVERGQPRKVRGRVLVAEDNITNQRVAQLLLERVGCQTTVASNGKECLESLEMMDYDLILMDCQMPEMDGLEAARRIRALPDDRSRIPIVALTAGAQTEFRSACLAAGMNEVLAKPIELLTLSHALARYLPEAAPIASA